MAEVVNLRTARKAKARAEAAARAAANRATFGRNKVEKAASAVERERHDRVVDGARRED